MLTHKTMISIFSQKEQSTEKNNPIIEYKRYKEYDKMKTILFCTQDVNGDDEDLLPTEKVQNIVETVEPFRKPLELNNKYSETITNIDSTDSNMAEFSKKYIIQQIDVAQLTYPTIIDKESASLETIQSSSYAEAKKAFSQGVNIPKNFNSSNHVDMTNNSIGAKTKRLEIIHYHKNVDLKKISPLKPNTNILEPAKIYNDVERKKSSSGAEKTVFLLRKYSSIWQKNTQKRINARVEEKKTTINNFIESIANHSKYNAHGDTNKSKRLAKDFSSYQHRYKVQKNIIALQKAKLEEQKRIIEELKYNKIVEATKLSTEAMKEEIRCTYYEIDKRLKPKIKCLVNEMNLHEIQEPALVLHCLKVPQFLQRMERRAREREERHAIIRERKKQIEEERLKLKQQAELARSEMDKEEKMRRMKELKEKRKREKLENIRKKQHTEKMRALTVMADLHYEKYLLQQYGLRPWKKLLQLKSENILKAKLHAQYLLKKNIFLHWMWYVEDTEFDRNYRAQDLYRKKLLKRVFNSLKKNHHEYTLKRQVAEDYYDLYVTQTVFRKFLECVAIVKAENEAKYKVAVNYYNSNITFKVFIHWRTLPALNALRREQEARKSRWRAKVLQVVPDYVPPED